MAFNKADLTAAYATADRADFSCKDPSYKIDMYGYCCEREALYVAADYAYNYTTPADTICRPVRNLDKAIVKNNMAANAEFVARLDAAVQSRFNQIGTLEKCVSAANMIPSKWDEYYLKPQGSVKFDKDYEGEVTLGNLTTYVDPTGDYGLVNHMGDELDEWMDMYYQPCLASLYGKNIGVSSDVEVAYFMAYPWHTHAECTRLTCLSDSMRWNRAEEKCTDSLIVGSGVASFNTATDAYCSYDVDMGGASQICKYPTSDISTFQGEAQTAWGADAKIDYIIDYFCMPVVSGKKFYVGGAGEY